MKLSYCGITHHRHPRMHTRVKSHELQGYSNAILSCTITTSVVAEFLIFTFLDGCPSVLLAELVIHTTLCTPNGSLFYHTKPFNYLMSLKFAVMKYVSLRDLAAEIWRVPPVVKRFMGTKQSRATFQLISWEIDVHSCPDAPTKWRVFDTFAAQSLYEILTTY